MITQLIKVTVLNERGLDSVIYKTERGNITPRMFGLPIGKEVPIFVYFKAKGEPVFCPQYMKLK